MPEENDKKLTKSEKYFLKKGKKETDILLKTRKQKTKKIIGIALVAMLAILLTGKMASAFIEWRKESQNRPSGEGAIEINNPEYDAGDVRMSGGLITHAFEVKNTGKGYLKISGIWTSCHCTTAMLKVDGKESPKFGMDRSPSSWSQEIAPGQTGQLEVIFDPAYHGHQGMGAIVREIYLSTNDPKNKTAKVSLIANVTN